MNLKDRILAQKTFEANKYKFEAKNGGSSHVYTPAVINRRLRSRQGSQAGSGSSKGEFGGRRPSTEQGSRSRDFQNVHHRYLDMSLWRPMRHAEAGAAGRDEL